jgi:TctA family transporter
MEVNCYLEEPQDPFLSFKTTDKDTRKKAWSVFLLLLSGAVSFVTLRRVLVVKSSIPCMLLAVSL